MVKKLIPKKYNLAEIDKKLGNKYWFPVTVAEINNYVVRAAAFKNEFHWHSHKDDEFFMVYKGKIAIDTEAGAIELRSGEGVVIPKRMKHKPRASKRAVVLMLEPATLQSKGD